MNIQSNALSRSFLEFYLQKDVAWHGIHLYQHVRVYIQPWYSNGCRFIKYGSSTGASLDWIEDPPTFTAT